MPYLAQRDWVLRRRLWSGPACERLNGPAVLRVTDQRRQPFLAGLLPLGADHPPDRRALVTWRLRLEERPGLLVRAKRSLRFWIELCLLSLFVAVDRRPVISPPFESLEPRGMHPSEPDQLLRTGDIDCAPGAAGGPRRHTVGVADLIDALSNAVDPPEAERLVHHFRPGDARLS